MPIFLWSTVMIQLRRPPSVWVIGGAGTAIVCVDMELVSAIGYRLSAISYRLSAIGYRLSAIGYQLSANGDSIRRLGTTFALGPSTVRGSPSDAPFGPHSKFKIQNSKLPYSPTSSVKRLQIGDDVAELLLRQ